MNFAIAYVTVLIVFGIIDAIWITQVMLGHYRTMLGDIMIDNVRIWPALAFYFAFPIGIVVFAVMPGLREGSTLMAFGLGLLFGALCYATYDLTNYATIKVWSPSIAIADIAYGAVVSGVCAALAVLAVRAFNGGTN